MQTIESLRKNGFKVRVIHYRYHPRFNDFFSKHEEENVGLHGFERSSFGGFTKVEVTTPNGETLIGKFNFGKTVQFNHKIAVKAAIGRALKGKL